MSDDPRGDGGRNATTRQSPSQDIPTLKQVLVDQRWHYWWKRQFPSEFKDSHRLALSSARAERAVGRHRKGTA